MSFEYINRVQAIEFHLLISETSHLILERTVSTVLYLITVQVQYSSTKADGEVQAVIPYDISYCIVLRLFEQCKSLTCCNSEEYVTVDQSVHLLLGNLTLALTVHLDVILQVPAHSAPLILARTQLQQKLKHLHVASLSCVHQYSLCKR